MMVNGSWVSRDEVLSVRAVYRVVWLKRSLIFLVMVGYTAFVLATGNAFLTACVVAVVLTLRVTWDRVSPFRGVRGRAEEVPDWAYLSFRELDSRLSVLVERVGVGRPVRLVYESGKRTEQFLIFMEHRRGQAVVHVGKDFLSTFRPAEQDSILVHELEHANVSPLMRASHYGRGVAAALGLVAGGVGVAAGLPLAVSTACSVLVFLAGLLLVLVASRAEERRADATAYRLFGERYVVTLARADSVYRPGWWLPWGLGDAFEEHPSLANRVLALRSPLGYSS